MHLKTLFLTYVLAWEPSFAPRSNQFSKPNPRTVFQTKSKNSFVDITSCPIQILDKSVIGFQSYDWTHGIRKGNEFLLQFLIFNSYIFALRWRRLQRYRKLKFEFVVKTQLLWNCSKDSVPFGDFYHPTPSNIRNPPAPLNPHCYLFLPSLLFSTIFYFIKTMGRIPMVEFKWNLQLIIFLQYYVYYIPISDQYKLYAMSSYIFLYIHIHQETCFFGPLNQVSSPLSLSELVLKKNDTYTATLKFPEPSPAKWWF